MQKYKSHKIVEAEPMTAGMYKATRKEKYGQLNKFTLVSEEGYRVTYPDGYVSWSPKKAFDEGYKSYHKSDKYLPIAAACSVSAVLGMTLGVISLMSLVAVMS